jgi:hypothetical protein
MELNKMILVIENRKGTESNYLLNFEDYKDTVLTAFDDAPSKVAIAIRELCESWVDEKCWAEIYFMANKSLAVRYCTNEVQLRAFLKGGFNCTEQEGIFDESRCSKECLETLSGVGMKTDGRGTDIRYKYERVAKVYEQGEILRNFNGMNYRVLEKLSGRNLLIFNEKKCEYTVAVGINYFLRFPENETHSINNQMYGIEWESGHYYGQTPSKIDFKEIREQYGEVKVVKTLEDYRESLEEKFYMYRKIIDSNNLNASVKEAAQNSMYEEFSTGKVESFRNNLKNSMYDTSFFSVQEVKKERNR